MEEACGHDGLRGPCLASFAATNQGCGVDPHRVRGPSPGP
jgi:hypothetical protein